MTTAQAGERRIAYRSALVIDSYPVSREAVIRMLGRIFGEVHGAGDVARALELTKVWRYDFVLIEIGGYSSACRPFINQLRARYPQLPIVGIVSHKEEDGGAGLVDSVLLKPVVGHKLHATVLSAMSQC